MKKQKQHEALKRKLEKIPKEMIRNNRYEEERMAEFGTTQQKSRDLKTAGRQKQPSKFLY